MGRSQGMLLGTGYDVTYSYDTKGRVGSVGWSVSGQSDSATYARVACSELLAGVTYGSGLSTTYGYEVARDLKTQVKNTANGSTISQYDYQYDTVGRRTSVANSGSAFGQAAFSRWGYNDRNELIESGRFLRTNVSNTSSPVVDEYRAYNFDPLGNRITATEAAQQKSYVANALNEYTAVDGVAHAYDADDNLTSDGTRRFVYDGENRLVLVEPLSSSSGAVRVRMAYDYLGRRVQMVVEEHDGSGWDEADDVRWVYAGWNKLEERRTSGGVTTKKGFVWGLDLSQSMDGAGGIGGLLAVVDEAGSQMPFFYDANGNVGQLVDEQGAVQAMYEYLPFGEVLLAEGSAAEGNSYRFSTKQFDAETGLVMYELRPYSPGLGRWIQRDPAGEEGGTNLLAFVVNAPTNLWDAFGLEAEDGSVCGLGWLKFDGRELIWWDEEVGVTKHEVMRIPARSGHTRLTNRYWRARPRERAFVPRPFTDANLPNEGPIPVGEYHVELKWLGEAAVREDVNQNDVPINVLVPAVGMQHVPNIKQYRNDDPLWMDPG